MSAKGYRLIYVGPADGSNHKPLNYEGEALGAVAPGAIVEITSTGLQASTAAATVFGELLLVADKDQMRSKSVDDPWVVGENMVAIQPRSGEFFNMLVATGQDLDAGTALTRNGAGLLTIAATDGSEDILCYSDEDKTTAATELTRVRIA